MKNLISLFVILVLMLVIGCSKQDKKEGTKETKKEFTNGYVCLMDGKEWTVTDSLCNFKKEAEMFSFYATKGTYNQNLEQFYVLVKEQFKTGDFNITKHDKPGRMQFDTDKESYWSESGKLTITKFTDSKVEGTVNAVLYNRDDETKKMKITDGKFIMTLR